MNLSIIRLIVFSALLYLLLTSIPVYFSYNELINQIHWQTQLDSQQKVNETASQIGNYIKLFQRHTNELAQKQEVKDIADVWGDNEIQNWAIKTRKLLPDTIGLAIVKHNGEVIGQPEQQRIGPDCLIDVKKRFNHSLINSPAYHNFLNGLYHFDLYAEIITDDGENYILLHTIRLNSIQELLAESVKSGTYLSIISGIEPVIELGNPPRNGMNFEAAIPGTTWQLKMTVISEQELSIIQFAKQSIAKAAFVISIIFTLVTGLLYYFLRHDSSILQRLLIQVGEKPSENIHKLKFYLQDFKLIYNGIIKQNNRLMRAQKQIEKMALEDSLTGLGNRHRLEIEKSTHLSHAKRGIQVSVITLDLDNFKYINDRYGHAVGDTVLSSLSKTLKTNIRESDSAYRLGGDEFIVLLYSIKADELENWYQHLVQNFKDNCNANLEILEVSPTISAGASFIIKEDKSLCESFKRSDTALYQSKKQGKGKISYFHSGDY